MAIYEAVYRVVIPEANALAQPDFPWDRLQVFSKIDHVCRTKEEAAAFFADHARHVAWSRGRDVRWNFIWETDYHFVSCHEAAKLYGFSTR